MNLKSLKNIVGFILCVTLLASCSVPQKIAYFQDSDLVNNTPVMPAQEIKIQAGDKLYVMVKAQGSQDLSTMFSLHASNTQTSSAGENSPYGFTVDQNGDITLPVVGKIHAVGYSRDKLEAVIKEAIEDSGQAQDVAVAVSFLNLHFSVLGEVGGPGAYSISRDKITIVDAISMAHDLTINGRRDNIKVFREVGGQQKVYTIDLTSSQDILSSPVYYLQQNDVVYVEPNDMKKRQSTVNGNNIYSTGFWISIASLLMSTLTFIRSW